MVHSIFVIVPAVGVAIVNTVFHCADDYGSSHSWFAFFSICRILSGDRFFYHSTKSTAVSYQGFSSLDQRYAGGAAHPGTWNPDQIATNIEDQLVTDEEVRK